MTPPIYEYIIIKMYRNSYILKKLNNVENFVVIYKCITYTSIIF